MALSDTGFAEKLKAIFDTMDKSAADSPKDNAWYAEQMAKAITDQIKTAEVNPGISITIPSTSPSGSPSQGATSAKGSLS
jgi:hypothetical protein